MSQQAPDIADKIEIAEVLARYCHRVDHNDAEGWAALFTDDGVFDVVGVMRFAGTEQLRAMPGVVQQHGNGKWRHQITSIAVDAGANRDSARVQAYGLVTEWAESGIGKPVSFTDYAIEFRRVAGAWRIAELLANGV